MLRDLWRFKVDINSVFAGKLLDLLSRSWRSSGGPGTAPQISSFFGGGQGDRPAKRI